MFVVKEQIGEVWLVVGQRSFTSWRRASDYADRLLRRGLRIVPVSA